MAGFFLGKIRSSDTSHGEPKNRRPDCRYLVAREESKRRTARSMLKKTSMAPYSR